MTLESHTVYHVEVLDRAGGRWAWELRGCYFSSESAMDAVQRLEGRDTRIVQIDKREVYKCIVGLNFPVGDEP